MESVSPCYEEARSSTAGHFQLKENQCYEEIGRVGTGDKHHHQENLLYMDPQLCNTTKGSLVVNNGPDEKAKNSDSVKRKSWIAIVITAVIIAMACSIILLVMLLNIVKSENAQLQIAFNQTTEKLIGLENALLALNISSSLLYQQNENMLNKLAISQHNDSQYLQELVSDGIDHLQEIVNDSAAQFQQVLVEIVFSAINNAAGQYSFFHQVSSCASLPPFSQSGYYWISTYYRSAVRVYCDMTRSCGNITGGWMRVAELDMTNSMHQCPDNLTEHIYNNSIKRTCVRNTSMKGCSSIVFSVNVNYTHVCGKVIGYQYGTPEAFHSHYNEEESIDIDGVILSHGHRQQHIWSFAAARGETLLTRIHLCPCIRSNTSFSGIPTSNVGDEYFCDTGSSGVGEPHTFYGDDPLWDGAGCENTNTCCTFNTPPWFYKQLPQPTTDYIEMRVCRSAERDDEDIAIESYEILMQ